MKAIVYEQFGSPDVLRSVEIDPPQAKEGEVLVRPRAWAINPLDWRLMRGDPFFVRIGADKIKRLGSDFAGVVESDGRRFHADDEVFGANIGSLGEVIAVPEDKMALKPANLGFEEAAAVPIGAITALQGLRKANVAAGRKVLINGAAGGVGTFAVQIAHVMGAEVTGVCSTQNVDMVRSLGADHVIDYTRDDFTRRQYDVVFDCIANRSLRECRRALTRKGTYIAIGAHDNPLRRFFGTMLLSPFVSQRMIVCIAALKTEDLETIRDLLEQKKITPVIDRRYPFEETADAMRYLEAGHARGKVVVQMPIGNVRL